MCETHRDEQKLIYDAIYIYINLSAYLIIYFSHLTLVNICLIISYHNSVFFYTTLFLWDYLKINKLMIYAYMYVYVCMYMYMYMYIYTNCIIHIHLCTRKFHIN